MKFFGDADLPALMAESGVPVVFGTQTGYGLRVVVERELLAGPAANFVGTVDTIHVATNAWTGLGEGKPITVDGDAKRIISARQIDDGALTELHLAPAT